MYNFHPGSHVKQGAEAGIALIAQTLNAVLRPEMATTVLLETMAGKGSEVGRSFEELRAVIDQVELSDKLGCAWTPATSPTGATTSQTTWTGCSRSLTRSSGFTAEGHPLNDSMNPLGSHKDRHQKLGEGTLGLEALTRVVNHPALRELPFYLETPNDLAGYAREIAMMKDVYQE